MFDIAWSELLVVAVVALVVLGPKDLPKAMRFCAHWVRKARGMVREFQGHVDEMVREAELDEVRKEIDKMSTGDIGGAIERTIDPGGTIKSALTIDEPAASGTSASPAPSEAPSAPAADAPPESTPGPRRANA
ncbi:MAG: Sec-independent protein translocase protein TatB [Alphaproteobacteria bacterium]